MPYLAFALLLDVVRSLAHFHEGRLPYEAVGQ